MDFQFEQEESETENYFYDSSEVYGYRTEQRPTAISSVEGKRVTSLVEWLNNMLPTLSLAPGSSLEDLRACLIDGSVLCSILNKLRPGLFEQGRTFQPGAENVIRFLEAVNEMGLPQFELSDLEQGYMVPVLQCLEALRAHHEFNSNERSKIHHTRKSWNTAEMDFRACLSDANILGLMKSNSLETVATRSLFTILKRVLDECVDRKNGDIPQHLACPLRTIVEVIEQRISAQVESVKAQNRVFRTREKRYQSRIHALETFSMVTTEENEVLMKLFQQTKAEKTKLEEIKKIEDKDVARLKEERAQIDNNISELKQELETVKSNHERHCLQLEEEAKKVRVELERKLKEAESLLDDSRKKVKELEAYSESKSQRWRRKEHAYCNFIDFQFSALKELRGVSNSIKAEVLQTRQGYLKEFNRLGIRLKGLADAAQNYHVVLAENRKLYNEVQDIKGNIRVYCRIRPFLPGQSRKQTTIEYVGENGELVVTNPLKLGKDSHRLFKFNKVFGPEATQEEVFMDTQPLIRSVLDGYNVCIFAYGQTGSGKTYTMSGPNMSSKVDWGVNYRALHDLFQISEVRKNSISYEVGVQMVEIYNEQVRDLLAIDGSQKRLGIWNITQPNGLAVPDATIHRVKSTADVLELMNIGLMNRAIGATALNERSSRSHSVLTVHVRGIDLKTSDVLRGNLHLVDLAGSERVDRSEAIGDRLREAQHINKSLSALGDVIYALAQKNSHVPYRNSKLTQLLQSSLGGQAKTLMFVQINPDIGSYSETVSTLKFAERVSGVELGAARSNKEGRDLKELMEQVASLKNIISKKDEEIECLQIANAKVIDEKLKASSLGHGSSSPRRWSLGTPRQVQMQSTQEGFGHADKAALDMDNCSDHSDRNSEAGFQQSLDDSKHLKESLGPSKPGSCASQKFNEDVELLGFANADHEERLSDISDSGLSMGTESDSMSSALESSLFPDATKPAGSAMKSRLPSKIQGTQRKQPQAKSSRLSTNKGTSKVSSSRKTPAGSSSSARPTKRW